MSVSTAPTPVAPHLGGHHSIALIDGTLADQSLLSKSLPSTVQRIVYNPATQTAEQVLELAADAAKSSGTKLDSLLIFSHGNDGEFALGSGIISPRSLQQTASQWKSLTGVFADNATIDLYGCDTAAGPAGQKLLNDLHRLSGATVFGSTNITGHGGDWILEAHSQNASAFKAAASPLDAAVLAAYPADLLLSVGTAPTANPNPVTSTTSALSVTFLDVGGTTPTVTWSATTVPTGGAVSFSANNSTTASNTTATFTKAGSYVIAVSAHDPVLNLTVGSTVTVTVNQTLTTIAVSPATTTLATGGTQQFAATGYDQFGNAMSTQPSFTWSKTAGTGSINTTGLYTAPTSAGSATIAATSGSVSGTASITVAATGPTIATPAAASPSAVTGTTTSLSVLGADSNGENTLTYTWAATTKPTGGVVTFAANGTNASKNTTASFNEPGTYVLTASVSDGTHVVTSPVTETVSSAVNAVNVTPGTANLPQNATQSFTAVAYDQFGNPLATQPTFTWTTANGSVGTVSSTGVYTAPVGTGTASVTASSGGVTGTSAVTVYNAAPTVATPAAATTVSAANTSVLSVLGADDAGESNLTYNWAATTAPTGGAATFSLNNSNLAKTTTATFNKVGSYTLKATITDSGGLSTSSNVNVTVGAVATTLQVLPGTTTNLNENGSETLTTTVLDQFGNPLGVQPNVTYAVASGSGTVTSGGVFTAPNSAGTNTVQITGGGVTQNVTINVTNAAPTITTPATANPNPVTGTTTNLTTLGADDGGEANLTYTWSATAKPAGAAAPTFSVNGTNASKYTTATFSAAGTYTFQVAVSDGTNVTDSSVSVVVAQTLTALTVTPPTAALHENATQQFTAAGTDQFGTAMVVAPVVTWSKASGVGTVTATGLYTAPYGVGTATVSATSGTVVGNASVAVTNAAPTIVTAAAATPNPVTGTTAALSVTATDDGGAANLTYTWSAISKPAGSNPTFSANGNLAAAASVVTFNAAGSYTFQVAVSDGTNITTSNVTVTVAQTLASIGVTAPNGTLPEHGTETLTAVADDQFGAPLSTQPTFTWNVVGVGASIDSSGDLTAGALPGSDVVTATSGLVTGTDTVTVYNAAPTVATPAAAGSTVVTGTGTTLSILGADDGGEANLTYTWAASTEPTGATPTFAVNGTNAAKNDTVTFNLPGAYVLTASISDGTNTTTSSVAVTVVQTLSSVAVTPGSTSLNLNATQQFNAAGTDQFGHAMTVSPTFTWSDAGVGSVSATGLYTSGAAAGAATITASSGGVSGTATATVTNAAPTIATAATATPVTGSTSTLAVLGADDGGEANLTYTWVATTKPAGSAVTFSANGTNAAKASTATFNRAGTYVLTANVSDGTSTTPSSVTVTVGQNVTTINVTPSHVGVNLNGTQQFAAAAFDQFNQPMATAPTFAWAVTGAAGGSVSSSGLYTAATTAGNATVTATAGGKTGSGTVTVANAAPTVATAAAANPSPVTGTTTALSVLGADDGGESNLTYTWAASTEPSGAAPTFSVNGTNGAKATTVTFNEVGTYTFTATITDAGGLTATSSVNVTVQATLGSIAVSPSSSVTPINGTQQFAAVADDQFGNALASQPTFAWGSTVGSVSSTGLYTAPATIGLATITASSGGISGTATDLAVGSPTIQSSVDPSGTSVRLAVVGIGDPSVAVTWAVDAAPAGAGTPTFSVNGTAAAQNTVMTLSAAGTYTVQAVENGNTIFKTLTVAQQLTTLNVSPAAATLNENGTQTFTAAGYDQFGTAMTVAASPSWAVTSGSGSISSAGVYTAPAAPGNAWITASESDGNGNTVTGTASVTVNNAAPTIATAPTASPNPTVTTTTNLSVLGADDGGESNLTYTWAPVGTNPASVTFSVNGTNGSKDTTATFIKAGTYHFNVAVSDGTNTTTSSTVSVVVTPVLGSVGVSPSSSTLNENGTQQFTATIYDQFGNAMSGQSVTWQLGNGSVGTVSSTGLYTAPNGTGSATVIATSGLDNTSVPVTITNAAPTLTAAAAANPSPVTGTTTQLSVSATDDGTTNGHSDLTYTWSTTSAPTGATPTFSDNADYSASTPTVTFTTPGNYTFQASITDGTNTITSNVNVTVAPTLTTLTINPAAPVLHENATLAFTSTGYDQFGVALASQPSVAWSSTGIGSINPTTGVFTTTSATGTATITGTANGVTQTITTTVTNADPTVAQAAAASPADVTGTTTNLTVLGADDGGEANLAYTWAATTVPAGATAPTFTINGSNAAKNATATFAAAGSYGFTVTISDGTNTVTSSVPVTVEQTATGFTLAPAAPTLNENAAQAFTVSQLDQFGHAMSTPAAVTWAVSSGTGTIDTNGTFTAPGSPEMDTVTATVNGVTQSATVTVQNAAPVITALATANPANVTGTTSSLSVAATDDGGAANLIYTWAATTAPTGATPTFSDNGDNSAANTIVTFNEAGSYTFQVSVGDGTNTSTSSVNVTVQQTLTSIGVSPTSANLNQNASQQFIATAVDQYGNAINPAPGFTWSNTGVGGVDQSGNYTAGNNSGVATVQVTAGGQTADAAVTVDYSAPTIATAATATPNPVAGTTAALSVLGADAAGESQLTYTWAVASSPANAHPSFSDNGDNTAKNATVTFDEAGDYTFTATVSDGTQSVTSSVGVTVQQTLSGLTLNPPSAIVRPNYTEQFTATEVDQFDQAMATQPGFTWAVASGGGTVSSTGLYTAPAAQGSASVTATADGLTTTAPIQISNSIPSVSQPATASPNPVTGTRTHLSVLGADTVGEQYLTYTWAATTVPAGATAPTFSVNGTNAAKHSVARFYAAGTYDFTVDISDGVNTVTSSVMVTVTPTATAVTVTPAVATLHDGDTEPFAASLNDQFGNAMPTQPAFTWSVSGGTGSVDPASGLYTAAGPDGYATVQATAGAMAGSANITVLGPSPTVAQTAAANPSPVAGTTTNLSVLGADAAGESALTYTWAMTTGPAGAAPIFSENGDNSANNAVATFNEAGDYTFTVTIGDGIQSTTSSVDVTVQQTATTVQITSPTTTVNTGEYQPLTAITSDQFNAPLVTQPVYAWAIVSGGTGFISANGVFFSPDAGTATVYAETQGGPFGSIQMTVTPEAPVIDTAAYADQAVVTTTSDTLHVDATQFGYDPAQLTYAWTNVSGPEATMWSDNADDTAKDTVVTFAKAGTYGFEVTVTGPNGLSSTSDVSVTVNPTLTRLSVTPPNAAINGAGTQQLTAAGWDQFGDPMTPSSTDWSLDSGSVGSVDQTGLFSSDGQNGNATVCVTADDDQGNAISGTGTITVSGNTEALTVVAGSNSPTQGGSAATLTATTTGSAANGENITYTWSVLSEPETKAADVTQGAAATPAVSAAATGVGGGGSVILGDTNGTAAAANLPVTFLAPGNYTFEVTASNGTLSSTSTITLIVTKPAKNTNLTVLTGVLPHVVSAELHGFTFNFSHALDPSTVNNLASYHMSLDTEVGYGRTALQSLFGTHTGSRVVKNPIPIASVSYVPGSTSLTVVFAKPLVYRTGMIDFCITGTGPHAVKDINGNAIDGNDDGKAGGQFRFLAQVMVGRNIVVHYDDGDVGQLHMVGPGKLIVIFPSRSPSPNVYLYGANAAESVVIGKVKKSKHGSGTKVISSIHYSNTATIRLEDSYKVNALV